MCISSLSIGCHEWKLLYNCEELPTENVIKHFKKAGTTLRFSGKIIFSSFTQNKGKMISFSWDVEAIDFPSSLISEAGAQQPRGGIQIWDLQFLKLIINFSEVLRAFQWNYKYATFPSSLPCNFPFYPQSLVRSTVLMWPPSSEGKTQPALLILFYFFIFYFFIN